MRRVPKSRHCNRGWDRARKWCGSDQSALIVRQWPIPDMLNNLRDRSSLPASQQKVALSDQVPGQIPPAHRSWCAQRLLWEAQIPEICCKNEDASKPLRQWRLPRFQRNRICRGVHVLAENDWLACGHSGMALPAGNQDAGHSLVVQASPRLLTVQAQLACLDLWPDDWSICGAALRQPATLRLYIADAHTRAR